MEIVDDESSHQHPKLSKPTNPSHSSSTSIQDSSLTMSVLQPELITEILLRLPVKSLFKFRSVSKSWLSLISSPQFAKNHLMLNNKNYTRHKHIMLNFYLHDDNLKECSLSSSVNGSVTEAFDLYFPVKCERKIVVGSINGLICLSDGEKDVFLWNPSIREYKKLPDFGTDLVDDDRALYGFGYDEFRDDYKVVGCFHCSRNEPVIEVKIYSLKDDSWRSVHYSPTDGVRLGFFGSDKFVNGKLHWANHATGAVLDKFWNIISIDLTDGKWEKVDKPCDGEEEEGVLVLGVLGNNLTLLTNGNHLRTDMDVWIMKEYGVKESWIKMFTVKCPRSPDLMVLERAFLISNRDEILLVFGKNFVLYNLKDKSIRYPKFPMFGSDFVSVVSIYVESLVSPILPNEPRTQQE